MCNPLQQKYTWSQHGRETKKLITLCDKVQESYLAALTGTDTIVVSRGFVLADEAGLVHPRRGWWGWWTGDEFLRTRALCFDGCRDCKQKEGDEEGCSAKITKIIEQFGTRKEL